MSAPTQAREPWQDAALPELAIALQADALAESVADAATDATTRELAGRLRHGRIVSARYKPGQRCLLAIELPGAQVQHGPAPGDMCLLNLFGSEYAARSEHGYADALPLPSLRAFLWQFPHDRKLRTLAHLATAERVAAVLARLPLAPPAPAAALRLELMHYLPEHGYTVRVSLSDGGCAPLYGKCCADDRALRTLEHMLALRARPRAFAIAEPLGMDATSRSTWQLGLERVRPAHIHELVPALRALHRTSLQDAALPGERCHADHGVELARAERIVRTVFPHLGARVQRAVAALRARLSHVQPARGLVHGDLHPGNYFIGRDPADPARGERLAFIDLDDLRTGDVHRELGSLAAHGINLALLKGDCPLQRCEEISAALADYRTPDGHAVAPDVLRAHAAMALLCERATRAITRMKLPSHTHLDALLEATDALIAL